MLAIIPARGGSKGLPGKNIKKLNGVPLIGHTIMAALKSKSIDHVVVTTDDENIASIAREYGAEVPFIRPKELATDTSSAVDVYLHAVEFMRDRLDQPISDFMVLLPTAPFRNEKHIDEAYNLFVESGATTLVAVKEAETPPTWYLTRDENGHIYNCGFATTGLMQNRQVDQGYYIPNGAIYILDYELLKNKRTYYCDNTVPYEMNRNDSVDIDTLEDFEYAEYVVEHKGR